MKNHTLFLLLCAVCVFISCKNKETIEKTKETKEPMHQADHLILAVNDLDKGMQEFEELTGVKPTYGGTHPGRFSRNAIVSLGNKTYIEIYAPKANIIPDSIPDSIKNLDKLTAHKWAISTTNPSGTQSNLKALDVNLSKLADGSRKTPDGNTLKFTVFEFREFASETTPFVINWDASSTHPSLGAEAQCSLKDLKIFTANKNLPKSLKEMGITHQIVEGEKDSLVFILNTPKGAVTF